MNPALAAARDPLASEQPPGDAPLIARRRRSVQTPSVTGINGAEAVTRLRGCGLIAAIESVAVSDDLPTGWVLAQDPPAGTPLDREAVVALQLVATREPSVSSESREQFVELEAGDDDTEQWFLALADEPEASPPPAAHRRRKRKSGQAIHAAVRDDSPPPEPWINGRESAPATRARSPRRFSLAHWRTFVALLTGFLAVVGLISGLGGGRHGSADTRARVTPSVAHQAVATPPTPVPARSLRVIHRSVRSPKRRQRPRRSRVVEQRGNDRRSTHRTSEVAVGHAASARVPASTQEAHQASAPTQFAYLGK
jgi:hypothetical protein